MHRTRNRNRREEAMQAYQKWAPATLTPESFAWMSPWDAKTGGTVKNGLAGKALRGPVPANGGTIELIEGQLIFIFDERTLVRLIEAFGHDVPAVVPAEPFMCIPHPPIVPSVGGFIDPDTGHYCRPAAIMPEWDLPLDDSSLESDRLCSATMGKSPPPPGVCCQETRNGGTVCSTGLIYSPG